MQIMLNQKSLMETVKQVVFHNTLCNREALSTLTSLGIIVNKSRKMSIY